VCRSRVYIGLIMMLLAAAGLAAWKSLYAVAGVVVLGTGLVVTGAYDGHVWVAFGVAVTIGIAIGVLNGVLVTALGIPSFIVTLALFLAWEGVTLDAVKSQTVSTPRYEPWFKMTHGNMSPVQGWVFLVVVVGGYAVATFVRQRRRASRGVSYDQAALTALRIGVLAIAGSAAVAWLNQNRNPNDGPKIQGVPWAASVPIAFMVLFTIVLSWSTWGRHLYAIGGSREAASRAGIAVDRVRIGAFVLCSTMAAVGGLFLADFTGGAHPDTGQGNTLLYAVAAAVIGGIPNGIQLHSGLPTSVVQEITGLVLLIAASVDAISRRRSRNA
jgi:D-xylose transport system permease protein